MVILLMTRLVVLDPTRVVLVFEHELLVKDLFKAPRRPLEVNQGVLEPVLLDEMLIVDVVDEQVLEIGLACNCITDRCVSHEAGLGGMDLEDLKLVK